MDDEIKLPQSEALLIEILGLLQALSASMDEMRVEIHNINAEIRATHERIDQVIRDGFPDSDLSKHRRFHLRGIWGRIFYRD